jgi:hypothetical protein
LEDIYLEYAVGYIFYYNLILNMKDGRDAELLKGEKLDSIRA